MSNLEGREAGRKNDEEGRRRGDDMEMRKDGDMRDAKERNKNLAKWNRKLFDTERKGRRCRGSRKTAAVEGRRE